MLILVSCCLLWDGAKNSYPGTESLGWECAESPVGVWAGGVCTYSSLFSPQAPGSPAHTRLFLPHLLRPGFWQEPGWKNAIQGEKLQFLTKFCGQGSVECLRRKTDLKVHSGEMERKTTHTKQVHFTYGHFSLMFSLRWCFQGPYIQRRN